MEIEEWMSVGMFYFDGTPCAVKVARTVWVGGKDRDNIKILPIDIINFADSATEEYALRMKLCVSSNRCVSLHQLKSGMT